MRLCSAALPLLCLLQYSSAACYFPIEFQGEFVMQSTSVKQGVQVQYSQVNITAEAIPIWGHCHRRLGSSVILTDSSGGANCSRCFHIVLRSRNVLQVRTEGLGKCYTNQDVAEATCPDEKTLQQDDHFKDIILYKTKDLGGEDIKQVYCPINGRFKFIYNVNDGSETKTECPDPVSELDNCPSGSALNLRFRRCSFENRDVTFQCLGHWIGPGDQRYLALRDSRPGWNRLPPYRCALYREESGTGNIFMAFSSDSTCNTSLHSSTAGFETFSLNVMPAQSWPSQVDDSNCRFPQWAHGYWQQMYIEGNTLTYKDHSAFKTYTVRCLGPNSGIGERFPVFARSHCGKEMYTCIWMKRRGVNVLEFQLGLQSSAYYNNTLCSDANFEPKVWITQGRLERLQESPCPVAGEYTGVIPDATNLCAKLSSDCKSPEIMYYTVSDCSQSEIYEGTRRRGRKRRQTGTRIYRISNPRSSTSLPSKFAPTNQPENDTIPFEVNFKNVTYAQKEQSNSSDNKYERRSSNIGAQNDQQSAGTKYNRESEQERLGHTYYSSPGPRYPISYRVGGSSTTFKTDSQDKSFEEEYDPWTFSKTHGQQTGSHTDMKTHEPEHNPHQFDKNRSSAWGLDFYHRTRHPGNEDFYSESGGKQQDHMSQWNTNPTRYGISEEPNMGPGTVQNAYNSQVNQRTPGPYRSQTEHSQSTRVTYGEYNGSNKNQGSFYDSNSHNTQGITSTQSGVNRNRESHYNDKYPGYGGNRGFSYNENSQIPGTMNEHGSMNRNRDFSYSEQRPSNSYPVPNRKQDFSYNDGYSASNRNQGFSPNENRTQDGFPSSNRNHGYSHNENRPLDGYQGSNWNQGFSYNEERSTHGYTGPSRNQDSSHTEHRSAHGPPGLNRDQDFAQNKNPQTQHGSRGYGSYGNHSLPRGSPNYAESGTTESYKRQSTISELHYNQETFIQNTGKPTFDMRDHDHDTFSPNPRVDQKIYPTQGIAVRSWGPEQGSNVHGRFQGQDAAVPQNRHWEGRSPSQPVWNGNVNAQSSHETVDWHRELDGPRSPKSGRPIPQPISHPVQFPPTPIQRPRQVDRPSAVPRTAAPSKREEREYRCLGQWEEDGLTYTYTQRRDVGTYECFVGSIVSNNEIYIKEAGDHCQRNIDPMHYGMKLTREGTCSGSQPNSGVRPGAGNFPHHPTTPWTSSRHPPEPTKPWKPITAPPREASGSEGQQNSCNIRLLSTIVIIFVYFCQN